MIVGADGTDDVTILNSATRLYSGYKLRRVYYSAFSPIPDASVMLPLVQPPLVREHRLYQADWLLRFYGFTAEEIATGTNAGHLDLELDPKLAWALQHRAQFPVDVNRASRDMLLRVPGFGTRIVDRIIATRRNGALRYEDLVRMGALMEKAKAFVTMPGWTPAAMTDSVDLRARFAPPPQQLQLI
jgi:predicted DNA-binding helix-hairpin-helix protein